jgi:hypothetical protein
MLKADHKLLQAEIGVVRDSVNLISLASVQKDSIIIEQVQIIENKDKIIGVKDQIITTQESQIADLKHNAKVYRRQRNIAYITSGGIFIATLILLL